MFTQDDIDAALNQAQDAVNALAEETGALVGDGAAASSRRMPAPAAATSPVRPASSDWSRGSPGAVASPPSDTPLERMLRIRVPVVVRIATRTMLLSEVTQLAPGSIVEFDRRVDAELDLMVNNTHIGAGEAIKAGEHFGLRVHYVGNVRQRIASLVKK